MKTRANIVASAALQIAAANALATTHYVDVNNINPTPPYTNWATPATIIQDAVDTTDPGDEVVVTNGVYAMGGQEPTRPITPEPLCCVLLSFHDWPFSFGPKWPNSARSRPVVLVSNHEIEMLVCFAATFRHCSRSREP
jgi:hypothetical protein